MDLRSAPLPQSEPPLPLSITGIIPLGYFQLARDIFSLSSVRDAAVLPSRSLLFIDIYT